jgi:hypothetical protein
MIISQEAAENVPKVTFPLTGPLADIAVGLEFIIVFLGLQIFALFLHKYVKAQDKEQEARNFAWGFLPLTIAAVYTCYIQGDFFAQMEDLRNQWSLVGYLYLAIGAAVVFFIGERNEESDSKIFRTLGTILVILIGISVVLKNRQFGIFLSFAAAIPILLAYLVRYTRNLLQVAHSSKTVLIQVIRFLISLLFITVAYFLQSDMLILNFGMPIRLLGDSLMIFGLLFFRYSLSHLPILTEFDWMDKIRALIVLNESGIGLFSRFFKREDPMASDEMLISGALSSIQSVLKTTVGHDKIKSVQVGGKSFIFETRKNLIFAIIAEESMESLQDRLVEFADEFMHHFSFVTDVWYGNTEKLKAAEWIADRIFFPNW